MPVAKSTWPCAHTVNVKFMHTPCRWITIAKSWKWSAFGDYLALKFFIRRHARDSGTVTRGSENLLQGAASKPKYHLIASARDILCTNVSWRHMGDLPGLGNGVRVVT